MENAEATYDGRSVNYSGGGIFSYGDHLGSLETVVVEQLDIVRNAETSVELDTKVDVFKDILAAAFDAINRMFCLMRDLGCEQQWENDVQRGVVTVVAWNSISCLYEEFETKMLEKRRIIDTLTTDRQNKVAELRNVREELEAMVKSCSSEPGSSFLSHNSIEDHFLWSMFGHHRTHRDDSENGTMDVPKHILEVTEHPQLKHMTKEEAISYYNTEMLEMSRRHDQALQEKTEELFRLKRELLKGNDSSHFRKNKESEVFRKKIPVVISKLDDIISEKEKLPVVHDRTDELCNLKDQIVSLSSEIQHLRGLLVDKRMEVKSLPSQVLDNAAIQMSLHSSVEINFLKQIRKLKGDMEDLKIEAKIGSDVCNNVVKGLIGELEGGMEDKPIETSIFRDIYSTVFKEVISDAMSKVNPTLSEYCLGQASLELVLSENKKGLCLEMEENKKANEGVISSSLSMKEKEKFASEAGFTLVQQQEHFSLINQELRMLRDQVSQQEILMVDKNTEMDLMKSRLDETLQQIHQYELEINELNKKIKIPLDNLHDAEKQNIILRDIIEDKQKAFSSSITKNREQEKQMKCIITSIMELSREIENLDNKLAENIQRNESRLEVLSHQCMSLRQQGSRLMKKGLWYKHILEIKSSNLQKAEAEVDILGDEVDAFLSLLGKIYVALDHYSPIFELYPGVTDILTLVQRELKGEVTDILTLVQRELKGEVILRSFKCLPLNLVNI